MSVHYGGAACDGVQRSDLVKVDQYYIMSRAEYADKTQQYNDTCRRCAKNIALGAVCNRGRNACSRCRGMNASGCDYIDTKYIPWTNKLYDLLALFNRERDRVLNELDMPLSQYLDSDKAVRDDIIVNDRATADAAWSLAVCQTTLNRILHFEEVHSNRTGDLISMPTSAPKSQQDYARLMLRERRLNAGSAADQTASPRLPRFLMSGLTETSFFATSSNDARLPDLVASQASQRTPRQLRPRNIVEISDDDDSSYVDSPEDRSRPRSAIEKRQDAAYGRHRSSSLNRGQTPVRRRSSLRSNSVRFTGTGMPTTPTPRRIAREATPGPSAAPSGPNLNSPHHPAHVEDAPEEEEEDGGVPVGDVSPPAPSQEEQDEEPVDNNPFVGMTPAKIRILTSAMNEAQLEAFVGGTPSRSVRRRLDDEFRASRSPRRPATDAESAREHNAPFLDNLSASARKRKRASTANDQDAMMSGGLPTPSTEARPQQAVPSTPTNDPQSEVELLRAILASQNETIRLQNLQQARRPSGA
ncbi:hypothetical protein MBLNU13_g00020t1 [Cladosporium sp. NU13]